MVGLFMEPSGLYLAKLTKSPFDSLSLQETGSVHDSMDRPKIETIS